jgi:hypothetical protein
MEPDNFEEFRTKLTESIIVDDQRHFLDFHFANFNQFAYELTILICIIDKRCPGSGLDLIKRIGSLKGQTIATYEQIVQALCELIIAKKFIESYPAEQGFKLVWEPTDTTKSNPEFMIVGPDWRLLVEVKCPSLYDYDKKNRAAGYQVTARISGMKELMTELGGTDPALPLDNKVKDYLVSAEKKFSSFDKTEIPTYGLLFICWGVRMFEAITPLSSLFCGLLKERSYFEINGNKVRFPNVSGVIVTQHQHFIKEMLADRIPSHHQSCLHYGEYWGYGTPPNPVFSKNDFAENELPMEIKDTLQTVNAEDSIDPIAGIVDNVMWLRRL